MDLQVAAKKEDAPEKSQKENRSLEKSVYRKRYAKGIQSLTWVYIL